MSDQESSGLEPRKGRRIDQDPDYHEAAPPDRKKLKLMEDTGKYCVGEKVKQILTKCFDEEIERQENEIKQIDEAIFSVQQKLQILRNVSLRHFFHGKKSANVVPSGDASSEATIHPAVKKVIGKRPLGVQPCQTENPESIAEASQEEGDSSATQEEIKSSTDMKVPRYVPPKLPEVIAAVPVRGEHRCLRKKLYIGNVSKWIPVSERTDNSSHRWMVYVRGPKERPNVSDFIKRVVFYLHPSYAPHDVVQVSSYPFHVTRRGWGEFPLRVQLFFSDPLSKPVNVIHNLKLDRTYTSLQTLGAETVIEVFVNDHTASLPLSIGNNDSNDDRFQSESADSLLHRLEQSANEGMDISMTESEPPLEEDTTVDTVVNNIKAEKMDENNPMNNLPLRNEETTTQSMPNLSNHIQTVVVKTEKVEQVLAKTEAPTPIPIENKKSATSPKVIQIKSCLPFNPGAATRLVAPGTTASFPNRIISPSLIRPMIVRCVNKEGVPIRLPISLLRNAIVVRPSRVIKPGESVLRTPFLRPIMNSPVPRMQLQPKLEVLHIPKAETPSRTTNDKENFEDVVLASDWLTTRDCIRKLAQNIRVVDSRASDPGFRSRHPFTCPSLETFASWNIGKQRSCEWLRAKAIRELLSKCKIKEKEPLWSVKVILRWCRHHGYSPMTNNPIKPKPATATTFRSTVTACQMKLLDNPDESDSVIDIESTPTSIRAPVTPRVNEMVTLNSDEPDLSLWIAQQLKKFGYQPSPEVCDGALVNFTSIVFTRLWKSLADDLLRRSLSEAWSRQSGSNPDEITLADAFQAVLHRPEFDLFTNAGLSLPNDSSRSVS